MSNVLVIGAGVVGSYTAHALCKAGNTVTILARGNTKEKLLRNGLVIKDHFSKKNTVDHPRIIDWEGAYKTEYDAVFAVMQYTQIRSVVKELSLLKTKYLILVGNNVSASFVQKELEEYGTTAKGSLRFSGNRRQPHGYSYRSGVLRQGYDGDRRYTGNIR